MAYGRPLTVRLQDVPVGARGKSRALHVRAQLGDCTAATHAWCDEFDFRPCLRTCHDPGLHKQPSTVHIIPWMCVGGHIGMLACVSPVFVIAVSCSGSFFCHGKGTVKSSAVAHVAHVGTASPACPVPACMPACILCTYCCCLSTAAWCLHLGATTWYVCCCPGPGTFRSSGLGSHSGNARQCIQYIVEALARAQLAG